MQQKKTTRLPPSFFTSYCIHRHAQLGDSLLDYKPLLEQVLEVIVASGAEALPGEVRAQFDNCKPRPLGKDYQKLLKAHYASTKCNYSRVDVHKSRFEQNAQFVKDVRVLGQVYHVGGVVGVLYVVGAGTHQTTRAYFGKIDSIFRHYCKNSFHYFAVVRFYKSRASANDRNPRRFAEGVELWAKEQDPLDDAFSLVPLVRINCRAAVYDDPDASTQLLVTLPRRLVLH
jgi:hypothetical protein